MIKSEFIHNLFAAQESRFGHNENHLDNKGNHHPTYFPESVFLAQIVQLFAGRLCLEIDRRVFNKTILYTLKMNKSKHLLFLIKNNHILPSKKQLKKMNLTQQEYIFKKWSYYKKIENS